MNGPRGIALRIWRDNLVRSLPLWLILTLLTSQVLTLVILLPAFRRDSAGVPLSQMLLIVWLPIAVFLMLGRIRARSHRLDLALPLSGRQLWLTHYAATVLAAGVVLAAALAALIAILALLRSRAAVAPQVSVAALALGVSAAIPLGALLVQRQQPGAWKPVARARDWSELVGGLLLIPAILLWLGSWPLVSTGLLLLGAAVLGRGTWNAMPDALELTPLVEARRHDTERPRSAGGTDVASVASVGPLGVARLLFTILHNAPPWRQLMPWVLYTFVALVGFFLAGGFGFWVELDESRILNLPLGAYMLFAGSGLLTYHLHRLDPLPVSRRALFRILVLPSLVVFCLGWAAGRLLLSTGEGRPWVEYRISGDQQWVQVPPEYLAFTTDGEAPVLTAPWGESHPAWHRPLFRGSRLVFYSPFNTAEPSSARFEALMTSRAIERVYGESIAPDEIQQRYFEVEGDRILALRGAGLTLAADYPALTPPRQAAATPFFMAVTIAPWLLLLAIFVRTFRGTSSIRVIRWVYWAFLLILLAVLIGQVIVTVAGLYRPDAAYGLLAICSLWLGSEPLLHAIAWLSTLVLIALCYALAEREFRRAELPASPLQCSLVDWGKGG